MFNQFTPTSPTRQLHQVIVDYRAEHPYSRATDEHLLTILDECQRQATHETTIDGIRYGYTPAQRETLHQARLEELFTLRARIDDSAETQYRSDMYERYADSESYSKLDDIKDAINRSAIVANVIDGAVAHPFWAGVIGASIFSAIKGKN